MGDYRGRDEPSPFSERSHNDYPEEVLYACDQIAALVAEGYIPTGKLPGLWTAIGQEESLLVMEALETDDG